MCYEIRLERESDWRETENLTREAFWDVYKPGCDEHLVVHNMRHCDAFIRELDLVASSGGGIIGNIMFSKAIVAGDGGERFEVLCLGPLTVSPKSQGEGIGSALLREGLRRAAEKGFRGVFLMGNPAYYGRFGFRDARAFRVQEADGTNHDYFMGLELGEGRLAGLSGRFIEDKVFHVDPGELEEFERGFPWREKHVTESQLK